MTRDLAAILAVLVWLAVMIFAASGCATYIDGTAVRRPASEHEGYEQYGCWAVGESENDACCWYHHNDWWQLVCTKDGGDTWDVMHEPRP